MEDKNCVCNGECLDKVMYLKDSVYDYRKNLHCIAEEGRVEFKTYDLSLIHISEPTRPY